MGDCSLPLMTGFIRTHSWWKETRRHRMTLTKAFVLLLALKSCTLPKSDELLLLSRCCKTLNNFTSSKDRNWFWREWEKEEWTDLIYYTGLLTSKSQLYPTNANSPYLISPMENLNIMFLFMGKKVLRLKRNKEIIKELVWNGNHVRCRTAGSLSQEYPRRHSPEATYLC